MNSTLGLNLLLVIALLPATLMIGWTGYDFLCVWQADSRFKAACVLGIAVTMGILGQSELARNSMDDFEWVWRLLTVALSVMIFGFVALMNIWMLWVFRYDRNKLKFRWPRWVYFLAILGSLALMMVGFVTSSTSLIANGFAGIFTVPLVLWLSTEFIGSYRYAAHTALKAIEEDRDLHHRVDEHAALRLTVEKVLPRIASQANAQTLERMSIR